MAARVQDLARLIMEQYDGDAARVCDRRVAPSCSSGGGVPGFGAQKAQIFVALLGKQLGVRPRRLAGGGGTFGARGRGFSVADITDEESLGEVRSTSRR